MRPKSHTTSESSRRKWPKPSVNTSNLHSTTNNFDQLKVLLEDDIIPASSIKDILTRSRDKSALQAYLTSQPPQKPLKCTFPYLHSPQICNELGFEKWAVLDLNRVACALGMGFFSLGSTATLPWGHIFFHKRDWTDEQREEYRKMSRVEQEALAMRWATANREFMRGIPTFGITLLWRGGDPLERPNPVGIGGEEIHVCPKARAVLWLQAQGADRRGMRPGVILRLALEQDSGLAEEIEESVSLDCGVGEVWDGYKRFSVMGGEAAQVASLERLERECRCEHYGEVIKLLSFWS